MRFLESGRDVLLFAFNHGTGRATSTVALRVPGSTYSGADIVTGDAVPVSRDGDAVRLQLTLDPGAVQVVRLQPR